MGQPVFVVNPDEFTAAPQAGRSISATALAAAEERTIISTTTHTVIEYLELATNVADQVYLRVLPKVGGVGLPLAVIPKNGDATMLTISPSNILANGHPLFDVVEYDTAALAFKIAFKPGIEFAGGVDILVKNASGASGYNCGIAAMWRYE